MNWHFIDQISELTPNIIDALVPLDGSASPFLNLAFLKALEDSACVGAKTGWIPKHLIVTSQSLTPADTALVNNASAFKQANTNTDANTEILAILPGYIKLHSYGEYVFDHSWANAYQQHGLNYYPKWINAIPFTPITSAKAWISTKLDLSTFNDYLESQKTALMDVLGVSSLHFLFVSKHLSYELNIRDIYQRKSVQFNWYNRAYTCFDDFLATMTARRRKSIKKERSTIVKQGVAVKRYTGDQIGDEQINFFYKCYVQTYLKRSGHSGYLNFHFFQLLLRTYSNRIFIVIAEKANQPIASALFFFDENALYGRYWGALEEVSGLHFEVCYYQGIDFCIANNIQFFNPGTQGEHKILRGFEPTLCFSNHTLTQLEFNQAVKDFLKRESPMIEHYFADSATLLPFKK